MSQRDGRKVNPVGNEAPPNGNTDPLKAVKLTKPDFDHRRAESATDSTERDTDDLHSQAALAGA